MTSLVLRSILFVLIPSQVQTAAASPEANSQAAVRSETGRESLSTTREAWTAQVEQIRANVQQVMGALPGPSSRVPLDVETISEERAGKYLRRKIWFTPEEGERVPAWLLIPYKLPPSGKAPAMLCLHQTTAIGKDEPAGLGGASSLHYAHELAERGYVCLVPDYPSFGEYAYEFGKKGAHYASGSMKAIWNNLRAVDLLQTLPEVNPDSIGVIGHSLGGHNAIFTAVFDQRLKAVVSSCGFTLFSYYYGGKLDGWTSDRYMPRIRTVYGCDPRKVPFDFDELIAALAPRGFFASAPTNDANFDVHGVRKAVEAAEPVYALFGARNKMKLVTPEAAHSFPDAERQAAYAWLDSMLK